MKCLPVVVLLAASFSFSQSKPQSSAPPQIAYLRCGTLYDGKSDTARNNVTVRIVGEKIDQLGETLQVHNHVSYTTG